MEYQKEGYEYFEEMRANTKVEVARRLFNIRFESGEDQRRAARRMRARPRAKAEAAPGSDGVVQTVTRADRKIGRNDPCPCGSGKKYKHCCGT
jgi:preprotein translocase subunit SecA